MNANENQAIDVLLPAARVAVFSGDSGTLKAAEEAGQDWRFARVQIKAETGDIAAAAALYKQSASPDLVIVQTDDIGEGLPRQLEELASHCDENTAAIVIGPVNDVYLYRRLIEMGVSDYLVRPVGAAAIADVIAKILIQRLGVSESRLIAFAGGKGGVGTTTLAEASAWAAADILSQKTALIDVSGGWSSLAVSMGFEPSATLAEAAHAAAAGDQDSLKRMLFKAGERLSVLASGAEPMLESPLQAEQMEKLIDMLMLKYPVVVADLSHAAPPVARALIARATRIVLVATPTLPALRLARSLSGEIRKMRGGAADSLEFILNKQGLDKGSEVPKADIEKAMEMKISACIAFDPRTFSKAESESRRLMDEKTGRAVVENALMPLLSKALYVSPQPEESARTGGGGLLGRLVRRR